MVKPYVTVKTLTSQIPNHGYICKYLEIRVITKLPNSEQSYKGKIKTHIALFIPKITASYYPFIEGNLGGRVINTVIVTTGTFEP
jgi:hypothetical protein